MEICIPQHKSLYFGEIKVKILERAGGCRVGGEGGVGGPPHIAMLALARPLALVLNLNL